MKIHIDISVFVRGDVAFGRVSGNLELDALPAIGTKIALINPSKKWLPEKIHGFDWSLNITNISFAPLTDSSPSLTMLSLQDVCLDSTDDAEKFMNFAEKGFDLFTEPYEEA